MAHVQTRSEERILKESPPSSEEDEGVESSEEVEDIDELSEEMQQEAVNELRELVLGEDNLRVRTDDNFLLRYLWSANFNAKKAFEKMLTFYKLKFQHRDWYVSTPATEMKEQLAHHVQALLSDRDQKGRRVIVVHIGRMDPSKMTLRQLTHIDDLWVEAILNEPETQKNGIIAIIDAGTYKWSLARWLTTFNIRVCSKKAESIPFSYIEYHFVHTPQIFNAACALIYPFLREETTKNVYFHYHDMTSLHKYIDPEILPEEFGGKKPRIDYEWFHNYLYEHEEKLKESFKCGYQS